MPDPSRQRVRIERLAKEKKRSSIGGRVLVLRFNRLERIPPALYETQLLKEHGFPILVYEFGNIRLDPGQVVDPTIERISVADPWLKWIPSLLRSSLLFGASFLRLMSFYIRDGRPQFLIAHDVMEQTMALWCHRIYGTPYVVHAHEIYDPPKCSPLVRLFLKAERTILTKAVFVIFPQQQRGEYYAEKYPTMARRFVVYNCPRLMGPQGIDPNLRKEWGVPESAKVLLYLGGVGRHNYLEEAIEATAKIKNLFFVIAGWGDGSYIEELKDKVNSLSVSDRVLMIGYRSDKWRLLRNADISYCVYGSEELRMKFATTASNKCMESIASGVPIILGPQADARAFLETYPVGYYIDKYSVESIVQSIGKAIEEGANNEAMKKEALKFYRTELNYEYQFSKVLPDFQKLLSTQN